MNEWGNDVLRRNQRYSRVEKPDAEQRQGTMPCINPNRISNPVYQHTPLHAYVKKSILLSVTHRILNIAYGYALYSTVSSYY